MRMLSILEPGVARPNFTPLSYTRLNSTYLEQRNARPEVKRYGLYCIDKPSKRQCGVYKRDALGHTSLQKTCLMLPVGVAARHS